MADGGLKRKAEAGAEALRGREGVAPKVRQGTMGGGGEMNNSLGEGAFGGRSVCVR